MSGADNTELTTTERGREAERLAADFLRDQGYRILERNYRTKRGEVDLIALDGDVLCFVEVRSRRTTAFGHPLETVDWRKRQRLVRAAQQYLARRSGKCAVRFDVVGIVQHPRLNVSLVRAAFEEGG